MTETKEKKARGQRKTFEQTVREARVVAARNVEKAKARAELAFAASEAAKRAWVDAEHELAKIDAMLGVSEAPAPIELGKSRSEVRS